MGMTLAEKILSEHAGKKVRAGEIAIVKVDLAYTQDGTGPLAVRKIQEMGFEKVHNPQRPIFLFEHAALVIKLNGIQAVLAKSFARIFYRNCFNNGLPAIICDTDRLQEGDQLELLLEEGKIVNDTRNEALTFSPLPAVMKRILSDGGLVEHVKKYKDLKLV